MLMKSLASLSIPLDTLISMRDLSQPEERKMWNTQLDRDQNGRYVSKYFKLIPNYDILMDRFDSMIQRARLLENECEFEYTDESFRKFVEAIGPVPLDMIGPTVGRIDHSKGYVFDAENGRWNFRWQSKSDNMREFAIRTNGTHSTGAHIKVKCVEHGIEGNIVIMKRWHRYCTLVRLD